MNLFLFKSTHLVVKAQKYCKQNGIVCKIIPVPRSISTDCGMAIESNIEDCNLIISILNSNDIPYKIHTNYKK